MWRFEDLLEDNGRLLIEGMDGEVNVVRLGELADDGAEGLEVIATDIDARRTRASKGYLQGRSVLHRSMSSVDFD